MDGLERADGPLCAEHTDQAANRVSAGAGDRDVSSVLQRAGFDGGNLKYMLSSSQIRRFIETADKEKNEHVHIDQARRSDALLGAH